MGCIVGDEIPVKRIERFQASYLHDLMERRAIEQTARRWDMSHEERANLIAATITKPKFHLYWPADVLRQIVKGEAR